MAEYMNENRYTAGRGTTALGIIGTALGGLATVGGGLGGIVPQGNTNEIIDIKTENAILKSELNTEKKIVDIYQDLGNKINALESKVDANASATALSLCTLNSATSVLQSQVAQLLGMTKLVIPSTNVCTPTTTTTT